MVCLGNICRSPLAEGILKSKVDDSVIVESAGTGGWHAGETPDPRSIAIARENGIDITDQRARKFSPRDLDTYDYIYAMDNSNYRDILSHAKHTHQAKKVKLILNEVYSGENLSVPDPYYGGEGGFKRVFDMLDAACNKIVEKLKAK